MNLELRIEDSMWSEQIEFVSIPSVLRFDEPVRADWLESHCLLLAQVLAVGFYQLHVPRMLRLAKST